ncbi:MAG: threonine/serine exporter family protein [Epulopiscium sp.]|nr:threonine/serine exporter family protein [Candidatus Epulonipiscium sp.]
MQHRSLFHVALLAGEIMLRNGAETYRVEDTINRILHTYEFEIIESFVTPTGIFVTIADSNTELITLIKRVQHRTTNLEKVALVNDISRRLVSGSLEISEALKELQQIQQKPPYSSFIITLSIGLASAFFTLMFGGHWRDFIASGIIGIILSMVQLYFSNKKISNFFINIVGGACIGLTSILLTSILPLGQHLDPIIIGSIMPLVPGVAITNAIRDTIQGDLVAGNSRATEAFLIAISIATGVGIVLKIFLLITGGSMP